MESLERRTLLTTVTSLLDTVNDGSPTTGTLRWAIQYAQGHDHTVLFDSSLLGNGPVQITLLQGPLVLDDTSGTPLTIQGLSGPESIDVQVPSSQDGSVFAVDSGSSAVINSLNISGGFATTGGGINNQGNLTISNCIITGNDASTTGGGIYDSPGAALSITDTTISSNFAGLLTHIGNDPSPDIGRGGGVYIAQGAGTFSIASSTLSGNSAYDQGGGLYNADNQTTPSVSDCTIAGNYHSGIANNGNLNVTQSTVSDNASGDGIDDDASGYTLLTSSIISGNLSGSDLDGNGFTGTYSLVEDGSGGDELAGDTSNLIGPGMDPLLGPLGDYGGPTQTMPLLSGSPAIQTGAPQGSTDGIDLPEQDQRGFALDPVAPDMGAYQTDYTDVLRNNLPDLPSYSEPSSDPQLPQFAEKFNPPVAVGSQPVPGSPTIVASNLDGEPDDTLTLTGGPFAQWTDVGGGNFVHQTIPDTNFLVYGQTTVSNGTFAEAAIQDNTTNGVLATIPSSMPGDSMYFIWPESPNGVGAPVAINRTDAQWMQGDDGTNLSAANWGSTISVYGRNMDSSQNRSYIYLQPVGGGAGQWVTPNPLGAGAGSGPVTDLSGTPIDDANPYRVQFNVPTETSGDYQVWVFNGLGGVYGWSQTPGILHVIGNPPPLAPAVFNVADYVVPDSTDDGPTIQNALHALTTYENELPGAPTVLEFPSGNYVVNDESTQQYLFLQSSGGITGGSFTLSGDLNNNAAFGPLLINYSNDPTTLKTNIENALDVPFGTNPIVTPILDGSNNFTGVVDIQEGVVNIPFTVSTSGTINGVNYGLVYSGTPNIFAATSQIMLPSNITVEGQGSSGPNATSITFTGKMTYQTNDNYSYAIGISNLAAPHSNIDLQSLELISNLQENGGPDEQTFLGLPNTSYVRLDNVYLYAANMVQVLSDTGSPTTNISISNSTLIGTDLYISNCTGLQLDNDQFYQGWASEVAMVTVFNCQQVSMTNCTTENLADYDPSLAATLPMPADGYGLGTFVEFGETATDIYFADNTSINLGVWDTDPTKDENVGEQVLIDSSDVIEIYPDSSLNPTPQIPVVLATANTLTLQPVSRPDSLPWSDYYVEVTSGSDTGDHVPVTSVVNQSGETVLTLSRDFVIPPDAGDIVELDQAPTNIVIYQNNLSHTTGANSVGDTASMGIGIGNGYDVAIDGNTITNTLYGISLSAQDSFTFADVMNNTLDVAQTGAYNTYSHSGTDLFPPEGFQLVYGASPDYPADPSFCGVSLRDNTLSISSTNFDSSGIGSFGVELRDIYSFDDGNPATDKLLVIERNSIYGFATGFEAVEDSDCIALDNQFYANTLDPSICNAFYFDSAINPSGTIRLSGNTYSGYGSGMIFSGMNSVPEILQLSQNLFYLTTTNGVTASLTFTVENQGSVQLTITEVTGSTYGVSATITFTSTTIASGQSVTATLYVTPYIITPDPSSELLFGFLTITPNSGAAEVVSFYLTVE